MPINSKWNKLISMDSLMESIDPDIHMEAWNLNNKMELTDLNENWTKLINLSKDAIRQYLTEICFVQYILNPIVSDCDEHLGSYLEASYLDSFMLCMFDSDIPYNWTIENFIDMSVQRVVVEETV